jgi:hypothetical protein
MRNKEADCEIFSKGQAGMSKVKGFAADELRLKCVEIRRRRILELELSKLDSLVTLTTSNNRAFKWKCSDSSSFGSQKSDNP